jgi:hypothetical protein
MAKKCDLSVGEANLAHPAQQVGFKCDRNLLCAALPRNFVEKTICIGSPQLGKRYPAIYDLTERQAEPC